MILDEMFKFPCVMVDGDNEQAKRSLYGGSSAEPQLDIVIGEASYPYFMLIGLKDAWMPTDESFQNALGDGRFDACLATFVNIGSVLVPWSKTKFEKEYRKFVDTVKKSSKVQIIELTPEELKELRDDAERETEE